MGGGGGGVRAKRVCKSEGRRGSSWSLARELRARARACFSACVPTLMNRGHSSDSRLNQCADRRADVRQHEWLAGAAIWVSFYAKLERKCAAFRFLRARFSLSFFLTRERTARWRDFVESSSACFVSELGIAEFGTLLNYSCALLCVLLFNIGLVKSACEFTLQRKKIDD